MHAAVSKESAVAGVLHNMGVSTAETMVLGDDANDVGLFGLCGVPVAMANAIPAMQRSRLRYGVK